MLEIMLVLGPHACSLSALLRGFSHSDRWARRMFRPSGGEGVLTPKCVQACSLGRVFPFPSCTELMIFAWFKQRWGLLPFSVFCLAGQGSALDALARIFLKVLGFHFFQNGGPTHWKGFA